MAQFRCRDGSRLTKYFDGKAPPNKPWKRDPRPPEALRWLAETRRDDELGIARPTDITVGEQINEWAKLRWPALGDSTRRTYGGVIAWTEPLGSLKLADLRANHIQSWINQLLSEGKAPKSVVLARSVLNQALEAAWQWERIPRNPAKHAPGPPPKPRKERRAWSARDAQRFLEATRDDPYHALWVLLLYTSIRQGAARALRWDDVDFATGTLHIRATLSDIGRRRTEFPKDGTGKHRRLSIPIVAPLHHALQKMPRLLQKTQHDYIFTRDDGTPLAGNQVRRLFARACRQAGLEPALPHELRHTAATLLADAGVPLLTVASILGHTNTRMLENTYHHGSEDEQRKALELLSERLSG